MKTKTALCTLALIVICTSCARAQQYDNASDFRFAPLDGGKAVEITAYVGTKQIVNIPPRIEGMTVTTIGEMAFRGKDIIKITIPNSVTSIGYGAFADCTSFASVTIPNSVTSIETVAFARCTSLASVTIGNGVTSIGKYAFGGCASLASISIPTSVISIGGQAFTDCTSLASITIPNGVTSIGDWAFRDCASLVSVSIPNSVTSIGKRAFHGCTSLASITIPNSVTSIGDEAFVECTSLTSVSIGNGVTSIERGAFFEGCTSLTSITVAANNPNYASEGGILYNKAKTTLILAPQGISGSVTIPTSVTSIGDYAFAGCKSLTSVTIPTSVTSIGRSAFGGTSLTSITVAANNPNYASEGGILYNKTKTTLIQAPGGISGSVTIPNGVTSIGDQAFYECTSLTSLSIPTSVTSIGGAAFWICTSFASVTFEGTVSNLIDAFAGNLRDIYTGPGTYTTANPDDWQNAVWRKQ